MNGPRGYNTNEIYQSDREAQIPLDFTYVWNLRKQNKQHKTKANSQIREQISGYQRRKGLGVDESAPLYSEGWQLEM